MKESMLLTRSLIAYGRAKNDEPPQGTVVYLTTLEKQDQALYDIVAKHLLVSDEQVEVLKQIINK